MVAGLLLGLPPALRALPRQTAIDLVEAGTRTTGGRTHHRTLRILVAAQVALATVLLVGSGLASRSFHRLSQVDPGFSPQGLLTFRLSLPERDYPGAREVADFQRRLVERLRALPGVAGAGGSSWLPLSGFGSGTGHALEDFPRGPEEVPPVFMTQRVTPGYFETLGIPLVAGRDFTQRRAHRGAAGRDRERVHRAQVLEDARRGRQAHRPRRAAGRRRRRSQLVHDRRRHRAGARPDPARRAARHRLLPAAVERGRAEPRRRAERPLRRLAAAAADGLRGAGHLGRSGLVRARRCATSCASSTPTCRSPTSSR